MKIPKPKSLSIPYIWRKRLVLLLVLVLFILAIFLVWHFLFSDSKSKRSENLIQKIDQIATPTTGCEEIIKQIGNETADDSYTTDARARLLRQQASCYAELGQLDKAISLAEQLKSVYQQAGDSEKVKQAETMIAGYKQLKEGYDFQKRTTENAKPTH